VRVTKRNGRLVPFDVAKIKESVANACEGLDVNPLAIEAKFDEFLFDGITTQQINKNMIHHTKTLAGPKTPDYVYAAGRLETMDRWATTNSYGIEFTEFVREQRMLGLWKHEGFAKYSEEEIAELGECIVQERDLAHSISSVMTANSKYLMDNECLQHMFMGNAMVIASVEEEETRMSFCKEVYEALSLRKVSLATPWNINLRSGGNISSCFTMELSDDLESIYSNLHDAGRISKEGGGLGANFSRLRAKGSDLMGQENASGGILGWNRLFNDTAVAVNQGGKRKGAFTTSLPIWHGDIVSFLDSQSEHGDQRQKSHDVKPQVLIPDYFMELKGQAGDDSQHDWYLFCPHEVETKLGIQLYAVFGDDFKQAYLKCVEAYKQEVLKVVSVVKAKALFKHVMARQFETGLPYIAWICRINEKNPNKHVGNISTVNLCTESFSVTIPNKLQHTCNLASIVQGRVSLDEIEYYAGLVTHILDNGIALTNPPTEQSKAHNEMLRTIGVGIQGYVDLVAREWKSFLDTDFAADVAERIQLGAVRESVRLAKIRGAYPAFKGSEWDNGNQMARYMKATKTRAADWADVAVDMSLYGIRNSQLTSPAPNTTTSIFMDAGAGVMPVYGAFFYEDNTEGLVPVSAMYIKENPLAYMRDVTTYKPWELTKVIGAMQNPWIDTGISAEYIMDKNQPGFNAKWLWDTLQSSFDNDNNAVYYIRSIKEGEKLVKAASDCVGCDG